MRKPWFRTSWRMTLTTLALAGLTAGCDSGALSETICGDAVSHLAACGVTDLLDDGECDAAQQDLAAELLTLSCEEAAGRSSSTAFGQGIYKLGTCEVKTGAYAYNNTGCINPSTSLLKMGQCDDTIKVTSPTKAYIMRNPYSEVPWYMHRVWMPRGKAMRLQGLKSYPYMEWLDLHSFVNVDGLVNKNNLSCKTTHHCRLELGTGVLDPVRDGQTIVCRSGTGVEVRCNSDWPPEFCPFLHQDMKIH